MAHTFDTLPGIGGAYARALLVRRAGLREGAQLPRFEATCALVQADAELLQRYRALCGFADDGTLPPTYLHVLAVPLHMALLTQPSFPLPTLGLVHVAQEIVQLRRIDARDAVALSVWVEGVEPARSGVTFDLITEGRVDGELVWRGVTTTLARTKTNRGDPTRTPEDAPVPQPGLSVARWPVPEDLGRRYAAVAGDRNPIHLYAWTAKLFGFKRAIIHGMWSMAKSIATLEPHWPQGPARFTTAFKRPVFLPSDVSFVHEAYGDDQGSQAFALWRPGTDKLHLRGTVAPFVGELS